jgi:hypothetical protein
MLCMEALLPMSLAEIHERHLSCLAEAEKILRCVSRGLGLGVGVLLKQSRL